MTTADATSPEAMNRSHGALGSLIRIPVFRRLWAGITLSSLGDWLGLLATTALAAYLTRDSSSIAQGAAVSGVLVTRLLPDLILGPVAGALVDRFDRRKVAIICDVTAFVVYLVIALAGNLGVLLVGQFLVEAVGLFSTPAKQAMWVNIVPRERLAVANQLNYVSIYGMVPVAALLFALLSTVSQFFSSTASEVVESSGLISGPASSAAVQIALIFNAATFLVTASILYFSRSMIPAFVGERSTTRSVFSLIKEGVSFVKNSRVMRALYLGILGAFGAGGLVAGVAQSYVGALGAGNAGYGILFGSVFTGLALGMLVGPKMLPAVPRRVVFTICIGMAGAMLLVMSVLADFVGAAVTAAAMGLFAGVAWITGFTMIGHEVSDQLRGRVFAFVMSSVRLTLLGAIAIGPVLAGAIGAHRLSIGQFAFTISGAGVVLAVGGLVAVVVSIVAGRQVGATKSGVVSRMVRRRRQLAEHHDRPGVLIAVEGADTAANRRMAGAVSGLLGGQGWLVIAEQGTSFDPESYDSLPTALRAIADLSEKLTASIDPQLRHGAVVVYQDYLDAVVVRFGALGGLDEERLLRLGLWVSRGAWPDLTVLVDPESTTLSPSTDASDASGASDASAQAPAVPATESGGRPGQQGQAEQNDEHQGRTDRAATEAVLVSDLGTVEIALAQADDAAAETDQAAAEAAGADEPAPAAADDVGDADQAYRERAASAPERYLRVAPLPSPRADLPAELLERIASVLRVRSPRQVEFGTGQSHAVSGGAVIGSGVSGSGVSGGAAGGGVAGGGVAGGGPGSSPASHSSMSDVVARDQQSASR